MNRRTVLAALAMLLTPFRTRADTIPVNPVEFVPVRPAEWSVGRAMKWACVCLRHGAHWTIGAISAAAASIGQVRHHLVSVHGHSYGELGGMSKESLLNLHDAHHEGVSYRNYRIPANPPNGVNNLSSCPGGNCPINSAPRRRGLARLFGG